MPADVFVLRQRLEHVGYDDRDLLDIVVSEGTTNGGVGLHAKTLHAEGESPSAEVQGNDAQGRAPAILIPPPPSRQSAFCRPGGARPDQLSQPQQATHIEHWLGIMQRFAGKGRIAIGPLQRNEVRISRGIDQSHRPHAGNVSASENLKSLTMPGMERVSDRDPSRRFVEWVCSWHRR